MRITATNESRAVMGSGSETEGMSVYQPSTALLCGDLSEVDSSLAMETRGSRRKRRTARVSESESKSKKSLMSASAVQPREPQIDPHLARVFEAGRSRLFQPSLRVSMASPSNGV